MESWSWKGFSSAICELLKIRRLEDEAFRHEAAGMQSVEDHQVAHEVAVRRLLGDGIKRPHCAFRDAGCWVSGFGAKPAPFSQRSKRVEVVAGRLTLPKPKT